jgi:preprotein translocase subunit SecF
VAPVARGGFNFGIEFRGGSEFRIDGVGGTSQQTARDAVQSVDPETQPVVTSVGVDSVRIQTEQLDDVTTEEIRIALADAYGVSSGSVTSSFIGACKTAASGAGGSDFFLPHVVRVNTNKNAILVFNTFISLKFYKHPYRQK